MTRLTFTAIALEFVQSSLVHTPSVPAVSNVSGDAPCGPGVEPVGAGGEERVAEEVAVADGTVEG